MRTSLDIDDDILAAVKELARRERTAAGRILSRLARHALIGERLAGNWDSTGEQGRTVFRPFPSRGTVVSNDLIDRLRDQEGF